MEMDGLSPKELIRRADAAWEVLRNDPTADPYEMLAAVVWPTRQELLEAAA